MEFPLAFVSIGNQVAMLSYQSNQNKDSTYVIRTMTRDELAIALEWAAAEGWNPGLHDVNCFYAADPDGFLMGFLNDDPIASISAVKYGDTFGFLGFYIVKPEFRGCGYGIQIWQAGLTYLEGRNVGLDGVVEQQENYVRSGFRLAHRNIRYEGVWDPDRRSLHSEKASVEKANVEKPNGVEIDDKSASSTQAITNYDRNIFLSRRSAFLDCWLSSPQHVAIGAVHNNTLAGYGVLRPCRQGYKIGPLFADTSQFAEALFLSLISSIEPGVPFYLDVPGVNAAAVAIAQKYGMTSVFETARMYSQQPLELPLDKIFGITTFELG